MTKLILKLLTLIKKLAAFQRKRLKDQSAREAEAIVSIEENRQTQIEKAEQVKQAVIEAAVDTCRDRKANINKVAVKRKDEAVEAISDARKQIESLRI